MQFTELQKQSYKKGCLLCKTILFFYFFIKIIRVIYFRCSVLIYFIKFRIWKAFSCFAKRFQASEK
jgi:hypothetical protein